MENLEKLGAQGMVRSEGMRVASGRVGIFKVMGWRKILGHGKTLVGEGAKPFLGTWRSVWHE